MLLGAMDCGVQSIRTIRGGVQGWEWVLAAVLVMGGCILASLGLVGEYVGRIYEQVKGRPLYLLKEQWPDRMAQSKAIDGRQERPPGSAAA